MLKESKEKGIACYSKHLLSSLIGNKTTWISEYGKWKGNKQPLWMIQTPCFNEMPCDNKYYSAVVFTFLLTLCFLYLIVFLPRRESWVQEKSGLPISGLLSNVVRFVSSPLVSLSSSIWLSKLTGCRPARAYLFLSNILILSHSNMINRSEHEFCGKSSMKVVLQFLRSCFSSFSLTIQFEWHRSYMSATWIENFDRIVGKNLANHIWTWRLFLNYWNETSLVS